MRPNLSKVLNLFRPNTEGISNWVSIDEIMNTGLSWSNNGNVRRGVAFGVYEYEWEFERIANRKIVAMRLSGHSSSINFNQNIRKDIVCELKRQTTSNFSPDCIVPLVESDKEIDHRWGRKDFYKYHHISDVNEQSIDDFQLLSHSHNQFKREQCVKCKNTNFRFNPPNGQDFKVGCDIWEDEVGCEGCPLAQPELYR
jgi:hypothetical protein